MRLSQAKEDREGFMEEVPGHRGYAFDARLEREIGFPDFDCISSII